MSILVQTESNRHGKLLQLREKEISLTKKMTCECTNTGLDLFTIPPLQTSIESGMWVEHYPLSTISDTGPLEFVIKGSGDEYTDLANTHIHIKKYTHTHLYTYTQIHRDTETHIHKDTYTQRHSDTSIHIHRDTETHMCRYT